MKLQLRPNFVESAAFTSVLSSPSFLTSRGVQHLYGTRVCRRRYVTTAIANGGDTGKDLTTELPQPVVSRRSVLSTAIAGLAGFAAAHEAQSGTLEASAAKTAALPSAAPVDGLAEYRGPLSLGFSFKYPADGWIVKKKPIKTHMAEILVASTASGRSSSSAGVTVDAVKIGKVEEFGTAEEVGAKVVAVEQKKDSVMTATLVSADADEKDGLTYYVVEYTVDGGRGLKRFVAKVTITGGNLYVFTAQAKQADFDGSDGLVLEQMVESFHVTKVRYTV
jgi:PsbP